MNKEIELILKNIKKQIKSLKIEIINYLKAN